MKSNSEYYAIKRYYKNYPSDWRIIKLGNLLEKVRKPVEVIANHIYQEIGIRSHGKGLFYKEPVKGSDLGNKSVFWIEADCLIINIVFAWEQAVGITTTQEKGMIASHRFPMWKSKGNVELNYLLRFFWTPFGKNLLQLASPGGAGRNKTLGQDEFNEILVCIPSNIEEQQKIVQILTTKTLGQDEFNEILVCIPSNIEEQQKIVQILTTWDRAIDLKEQLIAEKKKQKKWLIQNLLIDKWQEVRMGDVFEFEGGLSASRNELQMKEGICCLHYGDIHKSNKPCIDVKAEYSCLPKLTMSVNELNSKYLLYDGDVVFADASEDYEGTCKYVVVKNRKNIPFVAGLHTIIARPKNDLISDGFKLHCFSAFNVKKQFAFYANGISVYGINRSNITKILIPCPPLREQTAITNILSTADREIELHKKQLDELKKQKKALMQLLLTGIVRVNVEKVN